jgi:hypothetical protein
MSSPFVSDCCNKIVYGIPILYEPEHLYSHLSSFSDKNLTHIVHGPCVRTLSQSVCLDSGLATLVNLTENTAALSLFAESSHVLLYVDEHDREFAVKQLVSKLLPGSRLTVLSCPAHKVQVEHGESSLQHQGDFLLSAAILNHLGLPTVGESSPPLGCNTGLPLYMLSLYSCSLTVGEKPMNRTCFDSFVQLSSHLVVDTPDLSSTCIEFVGNLSGREIRVLLDSGASANFTSDKVMHELALPTAPISSRVQ